MNIFPIEKSLSISHHDDNLIKLLQDLNHSLVPSSSCSSNFFQKMFHHFLHNCLNMKKEMGYKPKREIITLHNQKNQYDFNTAYTKMTSRMLKYRKEKKIMKALALELLFEQLSLKRIILIKDKKDESRLIKFNSFALIMNILLDLSNLELEVSMDDNLQKYPFANYHTWEICKRANSSDVTQTIERHLPLDLANKDYKDYISHSEIVTQIYKKRKYTDNKENFEKNKWKKNENATGQLNEKIFDIHKGSLTNDQVEYETRKQSNISITNQKFMLFNQKDFEFDVKLKEEVINFVKQQELTKPDFFKLDKETSNNFLLGSLQHVQTNFQGSFNIDLKIPPLPKYDPNGKPQDFGISLFSSIQPTKNNFSSPKMLLNSFFEKDMSFTLPDHKVDTLNRALRLERASTKKKRFEDSIFSDISKLSEIFIEENNNTFNNDFEISNLWEDYGRSRNDNRFKNLNISPCGLINQNTCIKFLDDFEKSRDNLLKDIYEIKDEKTLIYDIIMLLMGISNNLYEFNEETLTFQLIKTNLKTSNLTYETLTSYLKSFIIYGTCFGRIARLLQYFKTEGPKSLIRNAFFHVFEDYTIHYTSSLIQIREDTNSLLDLFVKMGKMLKELRIIYEICFCQSIKNIYSENLRIQECIPSSVHLLDVTYNLLSSLELAFSDVELVQYIFTESIKPLIVYINDLIFKGLLQDEYGEFFISFDNKINEYIFKNLENVPCFIKSILKELLECSNNMLFFRNYERDYYEICKEEFSSITLLFTTNDIIDYHVRARYLFKMKNKVLDRISFDYKIKEEEQHYIMLQRKVKYLQKIKEGIILANDSNKKMIEENNEARTSLKNKLEEQIQNRQILSRYEKEIEKEKEKAMILEKEFQLKNNLEKEKKELLAQLQEINKKKSNITLDTSSTGSITQKIIQSESKKDLSINDLPITKGQNSSIPSANNQLEGRPLLLTNLESIIVSDDFDSTKKPVIEEESLKTFITTNKNQPQKLNSNQIMQIESNLNEKEEEEKIFESMSNRSSSMVEELTSNSAIKSKDNISQFSTTTRKQKKKSNVSENEDMEKKEGDNQKNLEIIEEEPNAPRIISISGHIPINIIIQFCLRNIIDFQTKLTNRAIMQLLVEKYKVTETFKYLKCILLGEKGDKLDNYVEVLFRENSDVVWSAVANINSIFDDKNPQDLHNTSFYFEFKSKQTGFIPQNLATFNLGQYVEPKCKGPNIILHIFNSTVLNRYLDIFCFILKYRFISMILRRKWKSMNTDILSRRDYHKFARLAQIFRLKIQNFLDRFQEYIYFAIIERSWQKLCQKITKAQTFDEIRKLHDNYLEDIILRCFIKSKMKSVNETLDRIISVILRFNGIILSLSQEEVSLLKLLEYTDELKSLDMKFNQYQEFMYTVFEAVKNKDQMNNFLARGTH